jgi:hypothetical protein
MLCETSKFWLNMTRKLARNMRRASQGKKRRKMGSTGKGTERGW